MSFSGAGRQQAARRRIGDADWVLNKVKFKSKSHFGPLPSIPWPLRHVRLIAD